MAEPTESSPVSITPQKESSSQATSASLFSPNASSIRSENPSSTKDFTSSPSLHALNSGHSRRPSAGSLSLSSRRQSLLTSPLPIDTSSLPQRLPRQPSADLAELHNELEIEQEAAVNRLLKMIREQQLQNQQPATDETCSVAATVDSSSTRARSPGVSTLSAGLSRQNSFKNPRSASRASSAHASSPALQPTPFGSEHPGGHGSEWSLGGASRDEASFYMAETHMLLRENEMLKRRIRELEKQLQEVKRAKTLEEGTKTGIGSGAIEAGESALLAAAAVASCSGATDPDVASG